MRSPKKRLEAALLAARLDDLEAKIAAERADRLKAGADEDEEDHLQDMRICALEQSLVNLWSRFLWIENRFPRRGRPPKPKSSRKKN